MGCENQGTTSKTHRRKAKEEKKIKKMQTVPLSSILLFLTL